MNLFEIIALISTILCVILSAKEHILAWPIGIISVLSLITVYISSGMYAQIVLQLVFLVQCIIGWVNWGKKDGLKANIEEKEPFLISLAVSLVLGFVYGLIVIAFFNGKNDIYTYIDGISAVIALLGNWYLTKKTLQAWPLFMTYNLMLVVLLASQGIYVLALLNICLFFISFNAYRTWKRNLTKV